MLGSTYEKAAAMSPRAYREHFTLPVLGTFRNSCWAVK
jgi:hypothetical protein